MARVAPGHRRWVRFLHGLPLDPELLATPLEPLAPADFIMCGSPRTGTTLLCGALFQPPAVVTVMEPWDGMRMPPAMLFRSLRQEVEGTGQLARGRMDLPALLADGATAWCAEGAGGVGVHAGTDFALGVKWPGYWRFIEALPETRFLVTIRHPLEVIASFKQAGGRVGDGLQYDTRFNRELNATLSAATRDRHLRRVLLFDYIHERLLPLLDRPNVFVVRYERWFSDRDALMAELGEFLGIELGPGPVRIREPRSSAALTEREIEVVRRECRTAEALGYDLLRTG